jgi:hypothetical protein
MMEHLQTPLTVEPYVGTSPTEADIVDADDEVIASGVQTSTARCFCKAVNCHNDLLAVLTIVLSEIRSANGYPHFTEEHIDLIQRPITEAKSIAKAGVG